MAEWRLQRRTALALIPLGLYFLASMLRLATSDQATAAQWLSSPVPALLTILFVLALLVHAVVGLRSVLVDYLHTRALLVASELLRVSRRGEVTGRDLAAVQRRREWPVRIIQAVQGLLQRNLVAQALDRGKPFRLPLPMRVLLRLPVLRDLPGRVIGFGVGRERLRAALPGV